MKTLVFVNSLFTKLNTTRPVEQQQFYLSPFPIPDSPEATTFKYLNYSGIYIYISI